MKRLYFGLIATLVFCTSVSAQFKLVKDITERIESSGSPISMEADPVVIYKDSIFFIANSAISGRSIYRSNGTPEGTQLAVDVFPGSDGPIVKGLSVVGDKLFYLASDPTTGSAALNLYVSVGTTESATRLGDMEVLYSSQAQMISANGVLYFTARDTQHGYELWKSDGTVQGTSMVKDVFLGEGSSNIVTDKFGNVSYEPLICHAAHNLVYFRAKDADHGYELWKTNGTPGGTAIVADINPEGDGLPAGTPGFQSIGNILYFIAEVNGSADVWKTDGTIEGTSLIHDESSDAISITTWNGNIYFSTRGQLFKAGSDDTNAIKLADITANMTFPVVFKDKLYFLAGTSSYSSITESYFYDWSSLCRTDGTPEGTKVEAGFSFTPIAIGVNKNAVVLASSTSLYAHKSSEEGLISLSAFKLVRDVPEWDPSIQALTTYHSFIFLAGSGDDYDEEPWVTTAVPGNMTRLGGSSRVIWSGYEPRYLTGVGSKLFFADFVEPWVTDGTADGTIHLNLHPINGSTFPTKAVAVNDLAVFMGQTTSDNWDLLRSNGTLEGTYKLANGSIVMGSNFVESQPVIDGHYYFGKSNALYKTDGNEVITVKNSPDIYGKIMSVGLLHKDTILFIDQSTTLWRSDGTKTGTVKVTVLDPTYGFTIVEDMMAGTNKTFFVSTDSYYGNRLWSTDGTDEGTLVALNGNGSYFYPWMLGVVNDILIFYFTPSYENKPEVWRSDGTPNGTFRLGQFEQGDSYPIVSPVYCDGQTLYFTAHPSANLTATWRTDGTREGTQQLLDFGTAFIPKRAIPFKNRLLVAATSPDTGTEIWETDFTKKGTHLIGEIIEGPNSSDVLEIATTNEGFYFIARDESSVHKLWRIKPEYVFKQYQQIDFGPITSKKTDAPPFILAATASSGLPITFTISGPAKISRDTLTLTGAGTVLVRATQEGNETYYPTYEEQSFEVDDEEDDDDESVLGLDDDPVLNLWPNPATSTLVINGTFHSAHLCDMLGRNLITTTDPTIDVSHLPRGMYVITLKSDTNVLTSCKVILR